MRYFLRSVVKAAHPIGRCRRRLWAICVVLSPAVRAARRAAGPEAAATIAPMNGIVGWVLVVAAFAAGWRAYGWPGLALAATVVVFCLLLQFSRAMRVMRVAGQAPVGTVPSAVMLQAKMRAGLRLMDIILLTRSLGEKLADAPETFRWRDPGGDTVEVELVGGRVRTWRFNRAGEAASAASAAVAAEGDA